MNLLHLRYFYEVARTRSFTESARNLRISQPAISKMVRSLESDLGYSLIERTRGALRLTPEGEWVFQSAGKIFSEVRDLEERIRAGSGSFTGEWSVGVSDNIAIYLMPPVLAQFKLRHPELRVSMFSGTSRQIKDELTYDRCQLGVFFTPVKQSEPFESRQISETEFWVVIARENAWFRSSKLGLRDLRRKAVPRIEARHSDYAGGFPAHFHSKKLGLTDPPWIEVNQHEVKKRLVLGGHGYALLTRHTIEDEVRDGKLLRVRCERPLKAPIYAVWKKGRAIDRVSEAFLGAFLKNAKS